MCSGGGRPYGVAVSRGTTTQGDDMGAPDRRRRERGVSSLQYVGLLLLAAVVVSSVAFVLSAGDVRAQACKAYGMITQQDLGCAGDDGGDGDDEATEPTDDQDFEPEKCKIHETGDEYSSVVKIGFIEIGENAGFVVTEYSDGTVTMMATNGSEIGATGGFGADAAYGELEANASVDFGGGLKFDYGSTWTFESQAQADQFRQQLDDYLFDQWSLTHPVCAMGTCMPRPIKGVDPPPVPSTTFGGIALTGDVSAELGISLTSGTTPLTQGELTTQGVAGQLEGQAHWTVTNDNNNTPDDPSDDTRTYVTDTTLNADLTGQIGLATGGTGSMVGMSYSIKKDADGNIIEVQIVSTSQVDQGSGGTAEGEVNQGSGDNQNSGGGSVTDDTTNGDVVVTETTLAIDPSDTASQQVVQDWMGGNGDFDYPGLIKLNMIDPSQADPNDPMSMLMHNNATSSTIAYDNVTDVQGFALNVKFGLAFGVDFSMESSETTATEATYLGAPRPDGTRPVLDYTECVS